MAQVLCGHMTGLNLRPATAAGSGFATGTALRLPASCPVVQRCPAAFSVQARYRGVNTDRARVPEFQRHEKDVGSTEVQIAQLSARVTQLTAHLQQNRKDYAGTRGLMKVLSRRKSLLEYLRRTDRPQYEKVIKNLGIRGLKEVIA